MLYYVSFLLSSLQDLSLKSKNQGSYAISNLMQAKPVRYSASRFTTRTVFTAVDTLL